MAENWAGYEVQCDHCGSKDMTYLTDEEDAGHSAAYEIFRCNDCKELTHVELPD